LFFIPACSTPPKDPGDIFDIRKRAEAQIDLGNKQADHGNLDAALIILDEAYRLAVVVDEPGLRVRAMLSRSNVLFSLGRREEAQAGWNEALSEAERAGNKALMALCRIHIGRGKLLSPEGKTAAQSVRDEVARDLGLIKSDRFYTAFAWTVVGLAEKELGRYPAAESAVQRSLAIYEKDRRFELAAYSWFMIASFRSMAGDYLGAARALQSAIAFDRRVENSWGLASDWRALGDVYTKADDHESARFAYLRSAEIFRSMGNEAAAAETLIRIDR